MTEEERSSMLYFGSTNLKKLIGSYEGTLRELQEKSRFEKDFEKENPRPYEISMEENALEKEINEVECLIRELSALMKEAEDKPCLIKYRNSEWIKKGDEVVIFNNGSNFTDIPETVNKFIPGKVTRFNFPYIEVQTDRKIYINNDGDSGDLLEFGLHSRFILKKNEFCYFKQHPDFYEYWMQDSPPNDKRLQKMTEEIKN